MNRSKDMKRRKTTRGYMIYISFLAAALVLGNIFAATAMAQIRIVVLPFYSEEGRDAKDSYYSIHYRRTMGFIQNQLVRHDFEVIDPFAKDASDREYNRVMERARQDSSLACQEMCKKYATDAAYIVWLKVKIQRTADGYCKASAILDGQGYDSGARNLGANVSKTFKVTKRDCDEAVVEVEKEVGDVVGRTLTAWSGERSGSVVVSQGSGASQGEGGVLERNIKKNENLISVRLDGANQYELAEIFGKVLNTVSGVTEAKRYSMQITPDNPQACFVTWRLRIEDTDPFRLQANAMKMIDDIMDANGELVLNGVPYRYTEPEIDLLKGIRPGSATTTQVQFVVDRERARDKEFQGRQDPYKKKGFE